MNAIEEALAAAAFVGQPVAWLSPRQVLGHEVLVRPGDGRRPAALVRAAQEAGAGLALLRRSVAAARSLVDETGLLGGVNIEPGLLDDLDALVAALEGPFGGADSATRSLVLEVTERGSLGPGRVAVIRALAERGYAVALDDLGGRPEDLRTFRRLADDLQGVKRAAGLVRGLRQGDAASVAAVAEFRSRGVPCTMEHLRTTQDLDLARAHDIQLGQGALIGPSIRASRPEPSAGEVDAGGSGGGAAGGPGPG